MARKYMLIDKSLLFYRVSHSESSSTRIGANKMFLVLGEWKEVFRYISEKNFAQVANTDSLCFKIFWSSMVVLKA